MGSIRIFLIAAILATLTLSNFVAALRGYQSSMAEAETLFDNQLLDLGKLVSRLDLSSLDDDFRLGNNLAFQVWKGDKLQAASLQAPPTVITQFSPGFDYANFDGYRWRTFTRRKENPGEWVIVAERSDLRFVLAENVVLESIIPILLSIPLVGVLIWFIVSRGLRPLQELSTELRNKHENDLSPVHYRNTRRELDQVTQSLNGFMRRLSQALDREKRFSADAAHELRTPISALKVQLHNLSEEMETDSETFQQLRQGVGRMQHLVEQLLSLYRVTPEEFTSNCGDVDMYQLAENAVVQAYPLVEGKGQTLELTGKHCPIRGEPFALETMLLNLLNNAIRYTQQGGTIGINIEQREQEVCLAVEDNGPGIPPDERERIFDRFYRSDRNREVPTVQGCGLGLAIVRHVVELHDARLTLTESSFSTGCRFEVCFRKTT